MKKKLLLNKVTIASLNANSMRKIIGAANGITYNPADPATAYGCQNGTSTSEFTKPNNAVSNRGGYSYDDAAGFKG